MSQPGNESNERADNFEHHPLADARAQIRLVRVHPYDADHPNSVLQVTIKAFDRKEAFKNYRALSYQWGDANPEYRIEINGRAFIVRKNLNEFLKHVSRKQTEEPTNWDGWYWIDALCINQINGEADEKTMQIDRMCETYEQAVQTIVWLGPGNVKMMRAMSYFDRVSATDVIFRSANVRNSLRNDADLFTAVDEVVSNSYFARVWIVQEIAVSEKDGRESAIDDRIRVISGGAALPWRVFTLAVKAISWSGLKHNDAGEALRLDDIARIRSLQFIASTYANGTELMTLETLVSMCRGREASKGQDYIYALLSLAHWDVPDHRILADYNRSGCSGICSAIRHIIEVGLPDPSNHLKSRLREKCERLVETAHHRPFDRSREMESLRHSCSGRFYDMKDCSKDTCSGNHCNALDICRAIATVLNELGVLINRVSSYIVE
ncbi:hypothetical protein BU26DRAFT_610558 [Trematosphaeria pertusa]|uniref:Heterokaryon incompatibility domain-containing protein n=1 Tax=Trematosphaeria pertusa TaxID=390896 RepID=A0A6A6HUW1_9PLEO|nr:uncharacterized protein BU26DRAFT_610558 [Trematosphaeria pertusa]KAF2241679.1 hypothetical protein BU26DRAFT_610558 [Trematosphaeria pertusa]